MSNRPSQIIFLPGAGGRAPDLSAFRAGDEDSLRFKVIGYPGWRRYVEECFSVDALVDEVVTQIAANIPNGPIRIVGSSIGGHFGYAAAVRLQSMGREIAGFCALDAFMIASARATAGWKGRAIQQGVDLLSSRRFIEFARFLRSKFWRSLLRLSGSRLSGLARRFGPFERLSLISDPVFEEELSMRLLIQEAARWVVSLDREPIPLRAPAILLRTREAASSDAAWLRRCPAIKIWDIPGRHETLFDPDNIGLIADIFIAATHDWRSDI